MTGKAASGFTLIEAMVALLVVAVAYAGVITALASFADQRWLIEQRNIAHRLAWDQLINSYLGNRALLQERNSGDDDKGSATSGSITWQWQINYKRTPEGSLSRYQVDVWPAGEHQGRPVRSLVIFLP